MYEYKIPVYILVHVIPVYQNQFSFIAPIVADDLLVSRQRQSSIGRKASAGDGIDSRLLIYLASGARMILTKNAFNAIQRAELQEDPH